MTDDDTIDDVKERRGALLTSIAALEAALAAPGGDARWTEGLGDAVAALRSTLADHVAETEADGGLFDRVRTDAPRMCNQVERLAAEHPRLTADAARLMDGVEAAPTPPGPDVIDDLREQALQLLTTLVRHRQKGADLVYEAYQVDVGGPG